MQKLTCVFEQTNFTSTPPFAPNPNAQTHEQGTQHICHHHFFTLPTPPSLLL